MSSLIHISTKLLDNSEKGIVRELLGQRCKPLQVTVARVYQSPVYRHQTWLPLVTGVVCVVNDLNCRSQWIRVYDLKTRQLVLNCELTHTIDYQRQWHQFHQFTAGVLGIVALNFADKIEAKFFYSEVEKILTQKRERLQRLGYHHPDGFIPDLAPHELKVFLHRSGILQLINDKDLMNYVLDFIDKNGGIEAVNEDNQNAKNCMIGYRWTSQQSVLELSGATSAADSNYQTIPDLSQSKTPSTPLPPPPTPKHDHNSDEVPSDTALFDQLKQIKLPMTTKSQVVKESSTASTAPPAPNRNDLMPDIREQGQSTLQPVANSTQLPAEQSKIPIVTPPPAPKDNH